MSAAKIQDNDPFLMAGITVDYSPYYRHFEVKQKNVLLGVKHCENEVISFVESLLDNTADIDKLDCLTKVDESYLPVALRRQAD